MKLFLKKHSPLILTGIGGVGVVVTTITAVKATPKALSLLEEAKEEKGADLTSIEKIKIAGPTYIPTVLIGTATLACIFGATILNKRKQASLISAYTLLDTTFNEYKNKVIEMYGKEADRNVKNEIAKDHYDDTDISLEDDKQLFYDEFSGRYFEATLEDVLRAEYTFNRMISTDYGGVFLNDFYELVGLEEVDYGNYLGWMDTQLVEDTWYCWLDFIHTKVVMDDGMECTIITFGMEPVFDFDSW